METTLKDCISQSSGMVCNGHFVKRNDFIIVAEFVSLYSGYDEIACLPINQKIHLDEDGASVAIDVDGQHVRFEFRVSEPLTVTL